MKKILILPYQLDPRLKDLEYVSEGIVEELIHIIGSNSNLKTTSRSTSFYIANNPIPLSEIKSRYNIDYVVEGHVKIKEGNYQLSTRLFNTIDEELLLQIQHAFSLEKWTRPLECLTNEIIEVTHSVIRDTKPHPEQDNSKAREFYLRGMYHWHRYTHPEILQAIQYFKKSIRENKVYAEAYAALADCYCVIGAMGYEQPIPAFKLAVEYVAKALIINNKRSDSYVSAAFIDIFYKRDLIQAKINLVQAQKLNADNLKANHVMAMYFIHIGDFLNAEKHSEITITNDPLAIPHFAMMIRIQLYQKKFGLALDYINAALNIDRHSAALMEYKGYANLFSGNLERAIDDFKACLAVDESNPMSLAHLAYAYSKANFHEESKAMEEIIYGLNIKKDTGVRAYALAIVKLGQTDYSAFFSYAEKAINIGIGVFPAELKCNPLFSAVRGDSRYLKLMEPYSNFDNKLPYTKNRKPATVFQLVSHTSEGLTIDPQDIAFIEANDNYCTVYWQVSGILKSKMLRQTLKHIAQQLTAFDYLVRCHKTFMINLNQNLNITGNARGHFFESQLFPVRIPMSRSKSKVILELFETFQL